MMVTGGRKRIINLAGLAVLLVLPVLAEAADSPFFVSVATRVLIYALAALSLDLILGYGGMVSFGHAAFVGLGAYAVAILAHHQTEGSFIPFLPGAWEGSAQALIQWPLAMVVGGLFALVIGALSLRTSGVYFIMITLAFAQMLYHFMVSLPTYGGQDGLSLWRRSELPLVDLNDDVSFYYVALVLLLLALVGVRRLIASPFGMVLRGARQNEARLISLGVPATRYKLTAFVIAGAIAGLAGALLANHTEFVGPGMMHWTRSGEILIMVILGGVGTLYGAIVGAATLLLLEEGLAGLTEHWMIFLGPFLVFVVLFARRGIYGWLAGREAGDD